jgi:hypothetical protein
VGLYSAFLSLIYITGGGAAPQGCGRGVVGGGGGGAGEAVTASPLSSFPPPPSVAAAPLATFTIPSCPAADAHHMDERE